MPPLLLGLLHLHPPCTARITPQKCAGINADPRKNNGVPSPRSTQALLLAGAKRRSPSTPRTLSHPVGVLGASSYLHSLPALPIPCLLPYSRRPSSILAEQKSSPVSERRNSFKCSHNNKANLAVLSLHNLTFIYLLSSPPAFPPISTLPPPHYYYYILLLHFLHPMINVYSLMLQTGCASSTFFSRAF